MSNNPGTPWPNADDPRYYRDDLYGTDEWDGPEMHWSVDPTYYGWKEKKRRAEDKAQEDAK